MKTVNLSQWDDFRTVIREEREAGKIPPSFKMEDIVRLELVKEAAREVDAQFGQGYE